MKVLRLDRIIVSKRAAHRTKDRLVIPVLEDILCEQTQAGRGNETRVRSRVNNEYEPFIRAGRCIYPWRWVILYFPERALTVMVRKTGELLLDTWLRTIYRSK